MAKFTKKAIMDCFLNMLKRKNIDRVTVTDICDCLLYTSDAADE